MRAIIGAAGARRFAQGASLGDRVTLTERQAGRDGLIEALRAQGLTSLGRDLGLEIPHDRPAPDVAPRSQSLGRAGQRAAASVAPALLA